MPDLVPGIRVFLLLLNWTWMAGTSPAMTDGKLNADNLLHSPRRNRMERGRQAPGRAGYSAERSGAQAGGLRRRHPRRSVRARRAQRCVFGIRRKPARPRPADDGAGARHAEAAA